MSAKENLDWKETCAKCMDGEIEPRQCEYYGEPNGCNSPTYGEHPNVGNAAKMRETIEWLKERLTAAVYDGSFEVHEALDKIDAALSAPPRNCDAGTPEEQAERFEHYCFIHRTMDRCCQDCPIKDEPCCELAWAQMPYAEEGGAA